MPTAQNIRTKVVHDRRPVLALLKATSRAEREWAVVRTIEKLKVGLKS